MQWSQLKKRLEEKFSNKLNKRIQIHQTRYRKPTRDHDGEIWVVLDQEQIFNSGSLTFFREWGEVTKTIEPAQLSYLQKSKIAENQLRAEGVLSLDRHYQDLLQYLNLPIESAIQQSNPLIRGLSLLDKRFGVRRLKEFDAVEEHEFVQHMFKLRCSVENITETSMAKL